MYRHMSHQTGAIFATEWFQTTEFMKAFKQPRPVQIIYKTMPRFHAGGKQYQYSGMAHNKKPTKENAENSAFGATTGMGRKKRYLEGRKGGGGTYLI